MEKEYLKKIEELQQEIDQLKKELNFYKKASIKDILTGVLNRRGIYEEFGIVFNEVLTQKERNRRVKIKDFSIIFVECDNFKKINDTFGHRKGDLVLKFIAQSLRRNFRKMDLVGRWGGDEFIVGVVGSNERQAALRAKRVKRKIENDFYKKFNNQKEKINFSLSLGIVSFQNYQPESLKNLINQADKVMYWGREKKGKGSIALYSEYKYFLDNKANNKTNNQNGLN